MLRAPFRRVILALFGLFATSATDARAQVVSTDYFGSAINQYNLNGSGLQGVLNAPGANGLNGPAGVVVGPDNNIYYSGKGTTTANNAIYKYNTATGTVTTVVTADTLTTLANGTYAPTALRFGSDNALYVARSVGITDPGTGTIDRFTVTPTSVTYDATIASGLFNPSGLAVRGGDLYVSNLFGLTGTGEILKISGYTGLTQPTLGSVTPYISPVLGNDGGLQNPTGLTFDASGNLIVADVAYDFNCGVRKYGPATGPLGVPAIQTDSMVISLPQFFTSDVLLYNGSLLVANLGGGILTYDEATLQPNGLPIAYDPGVTGFGSLAINTIPLVPEPTSLLAFTLVGGLLAYRRKL